MMLWQLMLLMPELVILFLLVQEGKAVQQILGHKNAPVHSLVVAVVDSIDVNSNYASK